MLYIKLIHLLINEAAFPVKAIKRTRGLEAQSPAFNKIFSAHKEIAPIKVDFPVPKNIWLKLIYTDVLECL